MGLERNQWLGIGILSGMAYLFGKERGEAESFSAEWSHPDEECWICNTYTDMEDEPGFLEILNKEHEAHKMSAKLETIMNGFGWEHLVAEIDWQAMNETLHLLSVPEMRNAIQNGISENIESTSKELKW